ncbi:predicted protein [Histoplasma capsulatum H143]|uniref:Uncharacterized protein n=1 Tax=Ajellomyces capsulatus (strain H143) TaxID=544712 RepID=C6HMI1_AJECH|nr:predicted protein [Histoplasma capsulatum H143]
MSSMHEIRSNAGAHNYVYEYYNSEGKIKEKVDIKVTPAASHTLTSEGQNKRAEPLQITVGDDDDGGGDDDDDDDNADVVVERQEEKKENNNEQKVLNKILEYGIVKWKNGQGSKRKERRKKVKTWDKAQ